MRVVVTGDRKWRGFRVTAKELMDLPDHTTIIMEDEQSELRNQVEVVVEEAKKHFRLQYAPEDHLFDSKVDLVLAFHNFLQNSRHTASIVNRARALGRPVHVCAESDYRIQTPKPAVRETLDRDLEDLLQGE